MHAEGASIRSLSVSDGDCYCDPQHSERYVCRDKEQRNLTLMAKPDESETECALKTLRKFDSS